MCLVIDCLTNRTVRNRKPSTGFTYLKNFENHGALTTSDGRPGRGIAAAARIIIRDERALR
jgi:hypothetical protein